MGELGFPELSTEQIELLCQTAEDSARKFILSKVSNKDVDRLDIAVEVEGTKPVNVTVEIDRLLSKRIKGVKAEALVEWKSLSLDTAAISRSSPATCAVSLDSACSRSHSDTLNPGSARRVRLTALPLGIF